MQCGAVIKNKRLHMRISGDIVAEIDKIIKEAVEEQKKDSGSRYYYHSDNPTKTDLVMYALRKTFPRGVLNSISECFSGCEWSDSGAQAKIKAFEKISKACRKKEKPKKKK